MKLSQAIREGSKDTWPINCKILEVANNRVCVCALGAALYAKIGLDAMLGRTQPELDNMLDVYFPEVNIVVIDGHAMRSLGRIVTRMNDIEYKSREEIADYVEGLGY